MENEKTNPIGDLMQTTMENVKNILKVDTVVGDPIYTPDGITLVPISRISVGFGGGGVEFGPKRKDGPQPYGGGNATGVKIEPHVHHPLPGGLAGLPAQTAQTAEKTAAFRRAFPDRLARRFFRGLGLAGGLVAKHAFKFPLGRAGRGSIPQAAVP